MSLPFFPESTTSTTGQSLQMRVVFSVLMEKVTTNIQLSLFHKLSSKLLLLPKDKL